MEQRPRCVESSMVPRRLREHIYFISQSLTTLVVVVLVIKSCPIPATPWTGACQAPLSVGFSRQEYWSGLHFLLQGIFLTQESNTGFLPCRQILYWLSYKGSPLTTLVWSSYLHQCWCSLALFLMEHNVRCFYKCKKRSKYESQEAVGRGERWQAASSFRASEPAVASDQNVIAPDTCLLLTKICQSSLSAQILNSPSQHSSRVPSAHWYTRTSCSRLWTLPGMQ